jgi:hypothetical protein
MPLQRLQLSVSEPAPGDRPGTGWTGGNRASFLTEVCRFDGSIPVGAALALTKAKVLKNMADDVRKMARAKAGHALPSR